METQTEASLSPLPSFPTLVLSAPGCHAHRWKLQLISLCYIPTFHSSCSLAVLESRGVFTYDITHSPETKQGKRPVQVLVAGLEAFEQGPQVLGIWSSLEREVWAAPRQVPLALQTRYFPCRKLIGWRKARARTFQSWAQSWDCSCPCLKRVLILALPFTIWCFGNPTGNLF